MHGEEELMAVAITSDLLDVVNLLSNFLISEKGLLKLLYNVEIDFQRLIRLLV